MKSNLLRALLTVTLVMSVASRSTAQSDATVVVPVTWSVEFISPGSTSGVNVGDTEFTTYLTGDQTWYYSQNPTQTTPRTIELEVGRPYALALTGDGMLYDYENPEGYWTSIPFDYTVFATTTAGYTVYVQGVAKGAASSAWGYDSLTIVVGPEGGCPDCGPGRSYSLKTDETRVEWSVDMGRGVNGRVIDPIRFAADSITSSSFNRNELNFAARSPDVERIPVQGTLQQVLLPGALLNAVDVTNGFEMRFYLRSQVTTKSGGLWQLQGGATPYVTYRFRSEDPPNTIPDAASFTRIEGAVTQINSMERDLSTGRWTVIDPALGWREVDPVSANVDEVKWWELDAQQNPVLVKKLTRTYAEPVTGQRELVSEVDGEGRETIWTYLGDTGYPGSTGKLNMFRNPRGGFEIYTYYNLAGPEVGQVARLYQPYLDTPDGTLHGETTLQTGRWSEYTWAEDINGVGKLLASRVDKVGSTVVGKETATHNSTGMANYMPLLTSTYLKHVDSNPSNALTTIRQEYAEVTWIDPHYQGKPYAVVNPDRTQISWVQQRGTWSGTAFSANTWGNAWREVEIRGSADNQSGASLLSSYLSQTIRPIYVMPGNSTLTIRIRDGGNLVREELHICSSGNSFELAGQIDREYSATGVVRKETRVDADPLTAQSVVLYDSGWTNGRMDWERDSSGVKRSFSYDAKGRVSSVTTEGVSGMTNGLQFNRTSSYVYDAADQVRQLTVTGDPGGSNLTLVSKWKYDLGGYLIESEVPGNPNPRKTKYAYQLQSNGRWKVTTTHPGETSNEPQTIEQFYRDGRLESIGGTAEIAQSFGHWINSPSGTETHSKSPFVQHSQTDWAGRRFVTAEYFPSDDTFGKLTVSGRNSFGQLISLSQTGSPTVRFGYNPLLGWTEQAVDVNANGQIDYDGMDPIRTADIQFVKTSGHWWRVETSGAFATDNSSAHSEIAIVETRLTGYSGSQLSQVKTKDVTGLATQRTTTFDWTAKKLETTVDYPSTTNDETITLRNGQVEKVTTAQGLLFKVTYDAFGREIGREDPRKGISEREFFSGTNDVRRVRNEADKAASAWTTTYTYNSSGRVATETNPLGMVTRYAYSLRGELTHRWGNGATPVRFEYNTRGQRTKMHTYRGGGTGWNNATWPASPGTADTTEWVYAPNSGVLTEKRDALWPIDNNRKVSYAYHADGQLDKREWARTVPAGLPNAGQRVKTTYNYDSARRLTGRTYNDGTPSVSGMTYNRRGQLKDVTDFTGARTFGYDSLGFMLSETLTGGYFGSGRSVQWQRDGYGRRDSVSIFQGSTLQFSHEYDYEPATGRLKEMTTASPGNNNGTSRVTSYEYHTNSNEWRWIRNTWAGHDVERTLETNRDAVSVFVQKTGTYKAIEATYTRDELGRLKTSSRDNTGDLGFEPNPLFRGYLSQEELKTATDYTYTERDELTKEDLKAKVGGVWQSVDMQGKNRMSQFTYDNAQNRETSTVLGISEDPTPNALNQPNTFKGAAVSHDLDGNMTGDGTWTYAYDAENRMISSTKTGLTITYAYDFMGRRVEMKSTFGTAPNDWAFTKRFIWDGWSLIADLWADYGNAIACTYVWGIDVSGTVGGAGGVGGLALMYYNGRAFIPLQDGRGNIHGYLDTSTGKNAVMWDFTAYGETIHERGGLSGVYGTQDFLFRYQSKMQDMSGHLLYFGHRFYHPGMGRFPNRDPIGEQGGLNLYGYVRNNPGNRRDYLGLNPDVPDPNEVVVLDTFVVTADRPQDVDDSWDSGWDRGLFSRVRQWFDFDLHFDTVLAGVSDSGSANDDSWAPTRENCDDLRAQYPGAFLRPGESSVSFNDVFISNALTTGAMIDFYGEEHFAWNLPDGNGGYFYTQPVSIGVTGGVVPDHPSGVLPLGGAHGHNIGLDAFIVFAPDIVPKSERNAAGYMLHGNRFSGPDIDFAIEKGASIIYTPSHEIRILTKGAATALPRDQNHARGGRLAGQPPSWVNARILQCLQQEYDD